MVDELTILPDFVARLIVQARALMAREETDIPDPGGNPTDDEVPAVLQEPFEDLSREELVEEIEDLDDDRQAELVALMWLGRGDAEAEEWGWLTELAFERHEGSSAEYLLGHPLLPDYWADGLDKLGYGSVMGDSSSR